MKVSDRLISSLMKENNIKIRNDSEQARKYSCNENYFEIIDTEQKAYWLGFMYADGWVSFKKGYNNKSMGLTLSSCDIEHLYKFKDALEYNGNIHTYVPDKEKFIYNTKNYSRLLIKNDKIVDDLIDKGCFPLKTNILIFPTEKQVPKIFLNHFIRGYNDGDGSIIVFINKKNQLCGKVAVTGTLELIKGIQKYFNIEHLKLSKRFKESTSNNCTLDIGGIPQVLRICSLLYENSTVYLDRKYEKYKTLLEKYKILLENYN